jgi:hypothetical protein
MNMKCKQCRTPDLAGIGIAAVLATACLQAPAWAANACRDVAEAAYKACRYETEDDYWIAAASCYNTSAGKKACLKAAAEERDDGRESCYEQRQARRELCSALGPQPYDPDFGPFVDPLQIGGAVPVNPFFPLVVGNRWTYQEEGGGETVVVQVLAKTKAIEGATCVVVNDKVTEDGKLVEDTDDWVAQRAVNQDVIYCGEEVKDFEHFPGDAPEEAELVSIDGSFKWGRDHALPGIWVPANPVVGQVYRQEFAIGDAEDVVEVLNLTADESVPAHTCQNDCLQTRDFTPLEPDAEEVKYYAPGIGRILEVNSESGKRVELVEYCNVNGPSGAFPACP